MSDSRLWLYMTDVVASGLRLHNKYQEEPRAYVLEQLKPLQRAPDSFELMKGLSRERNLSFLHPSTNRYQLKET